MKNMIDKFVDMCELISVNSNGQFFFDSVDVEFTEVYNDTDYPVLKEKMDKLIGLINEDNSLIEKDVQDELWLML
jgi:hypothetical protein